LGTAAMLGPTDAILSLVTRLYHDALESLESLTSPRAWAFALIGIHHYLCRYSGDTPSRRIRKTLSERLMVRFQGNATADWPWLENTVTYDNAKLTDALLLTGQATGNEEMIKQGIDSLRWLLKLQTDADGRHNLIGNNGWLDRSGKQAKFDQQPVDAMALVESCASAYRITGEEYWFDQARSVLAWFTGNNESHSTIYDYQTGGCRDGLHRDGPNLNQGAESTLAWLVSLMTVMDLNRSRSIADDEKHLSVISKKTEVNLSDQARKQIREDQASAPASHRR